MAGLLDFLQSASNEAAGTVSMPVDAIAWMLRKAGVPVQQPIGGSDWMEAKGLTRPVKQSAASVAGATAGLLSPVAAAAKAPQIARGLLQAGDNLAAPSMQGAMGQRGAIIVKQQTGQTMKSASDDAKALADELEKLTEQHGTLYARWAPSLSGDLLPNRVSRDFVSGSQHGGLSAVPISNDMHQVDILKRVREYGFLGEAHRPRIYKADRVGTDSDGYASIANLTPVREFSEREVMGLRGGWVDVLDFADDVERAKRQLEKFGGKSDVWQQALTDANKKLTEAEMRVARILGRDGQPLP